MELVRGPGGAAGAPARTPRLWARLEPQPRTAAGGVPVWPCARRGGCRAVPRPARHAGASAPGVSRAAPGKPRHGRLPCHRWQGEGSQKRPAQCRMRGAGLLRRLGRRGAVTRRGGEDEGDERPAARPLGPCGAAQDRRRASSRMWRRHAAAGRSACARPWGREDKAVGGSTSASGAVPLVQLTWGRCSLFSSVQRHGGADPPCRGWKGSALAPGDGGKEPLMQEGRPRPALTGGPCPQASPGRRRGLPSGCGGKCGVCGRYRTGNRT